jgi:hypothetical protein
VTGDSPAFQLTEASSVLLMKDFGTDDDKEKPFVYQITEQGKAFLTNL